MWNDRRKLCQLLKITLRQWASQSSLQVTRMIHFSELYKRLYNEETLRGLLMNIGRRILNRAGATGRLRYVLMAASAFKLSDTGITDDDLTRCGNMRSPPTVEAVDVSESGSTERVLPTENGLDGMDWTLIYDQEDFKMWQRPYAQVEGLMEYKCIGTYRDVSALSFFTTQLDLEYRKEWDKYVIKLEVLEEEQQSSSEVVRWITYCPFPMYSREYLFGRRWRVENDKLMLIARGVDLESYPSSKDHVRVAHYETQMVIKPHSQMDKPGMDYTMIYRADPMCNIPGIAYKWMVKQGIPGFLDQVHQAAKAFEPGNDARSQPRKLQYYPNATQIPSAKTTMNL